MIQLNKCKKHFNLDEIKIELSYLCHMKCLHCSSEGARDKIESISYEEVQMIINSAQKLNVKNISISGGEPFLWPNFRELIDFLQTKNLNIKIYTSGSSDNYSSIIDKINPANISMIFSLYSSNPNVHDNITGIRGSYNKSVSAIQATLYRSFNTEVHFVPLKTNYTELIGLAALANKIGIKKISVLRFVPQGRGAQNHHLILNKMENLELKRQILNLRESGFNIRTGSPFNFLCLEGQPLCKSGINKLIIGPNLSIYPCDAFKQISSDSIFCNDEFSSLRKHSLLDCWKKSVYLNKIRDILRHELKEPCLSCQKTDLCKSGCLAQKVILNKSMRQAVDPSCLIYCDLVEGG